MVEISPTCIAPHVAEIQTVRVDFGGRVAADAMKQKEPKHKTLNSAGLDVCALSVSWCAYRRKIDGYRFLCVTLRPRVSVLRQQNSVNYLSKAKISPAV